MKDIKQPLFDPFENFLEQQLQSHKPYLDDAGFSENLMQQLPQRKSLPRWLVILVFLLPLALVIVLISHQLGLNQLLGGLYKALILSSPKTLVLVAMSLSLGLLISAAGWVLNQLRVI